MFTRKYLDVLSHVRFFLVCSTILSLALTGLLNKNHSTGALVRKILEGLVIEIFEFLLIFEEEPRIDNEIRLVN